MYKTGDIVKVIKCPIKHKKFVGEIRKIVRHTRRYDDSMTWWTILPNEENLIDNQAWFTDDEIELHNPTPDEVIKYLSL